MVGIVEPQGGRFAVYPQVVQDRHEPVEISAPFAEDQAEAAIPDFAVLGTESLHPGFHFAPILDPAVEAHGTLDWMCEERFVVLQADRKIVEQVLAIIEQGRDALGGEQLRIGLALDQQPLHLCELEIGQVGQRQHTECE